jgi:hypothetical protein
MVFLILLKYLPEGKKNRSGFKPGGCHLVKQRRKLMIIMLVNYYYLKS